MKLNAALIVKTEIVIPGDSKIVANWTREMLAPVIPGIQMDGIGNWSCPRLKLHGFSTRQKLINAINRKASK